MLEVSLIGAFIAGLISFITPCVLPMVPFQLAYLAGSNVDALKSKELADRVFRRRAIINACAFAIGLVTIFVILGLSATALGKLLRSNIDLIRNLAAILIFIFGLHFTGLVRIPLLMREARIDQPKMQQKTGGGFISAFLVGLAFAFGWTACVGPILSSILVLAAQTGSVKTGGLLLFFYGLGMASPFVLAAVFFAYFVAAYSRFRAHLERVELFAGVMMMIFAVLLFTNQLNRISQWMIETFPAFTNIL